MTFEHRHEQKYLMARFSKPERNPDFVCNVCNESFAKGQQLYDHRRYRHSKQQLQEATKQIQTWKC